MTLSSCPIVRQTVACQSIDPLLKLFRNRSRREIFCCLALGERDVGSLAQASGNDISYVSFALKAMDACGLVERRRKKNHVIYRLNQNVYVSFSDGVFHIEVQTTNGEYLALDLHVKVMKDSAQSESMDGHP